MESNFDKIASELYKKIQTRFKDIKIAEEHAEVLSRKEDIPKARFFEFEFEEGGRPLGTIAITLDHDDGIVVQTSGDLTQDHSSAIKNSVYEFLKSLRQFARKRLIKFNVRNIGKRNLDQRDYTFQAKRKEYAPMPAIMENKLYGSNRISYQDLGEARLIIKHSQPINTEYAAGRSQHIQNIYIESAEGERFRYPFKHLNGARALAEHIKHGGNPYDSIGKHIVGLSEELAHLRKFKNYVGRQEQISEAMGSISDRVVERIENIKKQVNQLQRSTFYEQFAESFVERQEKIIPEDLVNDWVDRLTIRTFNEELKGVFPYLYELIDESELPVKTLNPDDLINDDLINEKFDTGRLPDEEKDLIDFSKYTPEQVEEIEDLKNIVEKIWLRQNINVEIPVVPIKDRLPDGPKHEIHIYDRMKDAERRGTISGIRRAMFTMASNPYVIKILEIMPKTADDEKTLVFAFTDSDWKPLPGDPVTTNPGIMFIPFFKKAPNDFSITSFIRGGHGSSIRPIVWVESKEDDVVWQNPPDWAIDKYLVNKTKSSRVSGPSSSNDSSGLSTQSSTQSQASNPIPITPVKSRSSGRSTLSLKKPKNDQDSTKTHASTSTPFTPASGLKSNDVIPQTTTTDLNKPDIYANFGAYHSSDKRKGKKESIESMFESFMESLANTNTGIFNPDPAARRDAIDKLNDLLKNEILAGPDGINARNSLTGIIDDPVFLDSLRGINPNFRSLIQQYVLEIDPNLVYELKFEPDSQEISSEPKTETPPAPEMTPPPTEMPSGAPGEMPPAEMPPAEMPPTPGAPIAERFESGFKRDFKSRTRPGFTFSNRRKLGLKNIIKKAQRAGATLETMMNIGMESYTIEDIINECGFSIEECGFSKANGVDEILEFAEGFWNNEDDNFTIGGTRLKTKLAKEFEEGRFKNATSQDLEEVFSIIDERDPSSNEHNQIMRLANVPERGPYLSRELDSREKELGEVVAAMQESAADTMKKFINKINLEN